MYAIHWKTIVLTAACVCLAAAAADAQQPTITLPGGMVYKAGPDFASDVLQDPWDFSNIEDISPDPDDFGNWVQATPARTIGTGQAFLSARPGHFFGTATGHSRMALLHRPIHDTVMTGRNGARYPIDSTVFSKMAVKMRVEAAAPRGEEHLRVLWWHTLNAVTPPPIGGSADFEPTVPNGNSARIYVLDLATAPPNGAPYPNDAVRGLWLDPLFASGNVEIDWVRLTASDNDPNALMIPVQLTNCAGFQHLTVTDIDGFTTRIANQAAFNAGVFPPGDYNVRATCGGVDTLPVDFTINAPPQVTVLTPDEKGDPATDWATMNGDAWDFEQETDIDRVGNVTISGGACATVGGCGFVPTTFPGKTGLMFRGSSTGTTPSELGDPVLGILDGAIVPINSLKHRILSFSMQNQRPYDLAVGSVARFFWGSEASSDGLRVTGTEDMLVFPGPQTYTIDLSTLTAANGGIETGCPGCRTTPWATRALRHFRIDPHEFGDVPTAFAIDDVTLTAPYTVNVGQAFGVTFAFQDLDAPGSTYAARIYAQPWAGGTRTELGTMPGINPGPGAHAFSFVPQAHGLGAGEYRIVVEVDEVRPTPIPPGSFTHTSRALATGMLVVKNPAASAPQLTLAYPPANQAVGLPLTVQGCAYDNGPGASGAGINVDDIAISMRAIAGPRTGMTIPLGFEPLAPHTGVLDFLPVNSVAVPCPGAGGVYANAGFRVAGIGAGLGTWMDGTWVLDVSARSTISGEMIVYPEVTFHIGDAPPSAPVNFAAHAQGHTVTVSWQPPPSGAASYLIEVSTTPDFGNLFYSLNVAQAGQYSGVLPSGTYYLRVSSRSASGALSSPSPAIRVDVALPTPPGAPVLVASQVSSNPVTLNWSAGPGGSPTGYTIYAGTQPGASDVIIAPLGLATGVTAVAPINAQLYVRVVASNAAGQAVSNEISFILQPPGPPTLAPAQVAGPNVTLSWTPPAGAVPTHYTIRARYEATGPIIASLPVPGTSFTVAAPPGTYIVTAVSHSPLGTSVESTPITVRVDP